MKKSGDYILKTDKQDVLIEVQEKKLSDDIVGKLIAVRKSLKLTQQDIADMTGMKAPNVTRIESRKYTPTLNVLVRYAGALGKEIQFDLVDKTENEDAADK